MTIRLTGAALCALFAATSLGATGARADTDSAVGSINTENGVHAVPTGRVTSDALPVIGRATLIRPRMAPRQHASVHATAPKLTVRVADAAPARARHTRLERTESPVPVQLTAADAPAAPDAGQAEDYQVQPIALISPMQPPSMPTLESDDPAPEAADSRPSQIVEAEPVGDPASPALAPTPVSRAVEEPGMRQHIAFPRRSAEAASAFERYARFASRLDARLQGSASVGDALRTGAAYDGGQLEEGMIAYGAIAALQDSRFVYAVMDVAQDPDARQRLIEALLADPTLASRLPGAGEAAAMADAAILGQARPLVAAGRALKQASYDLQHQPWSLEPAADPQGRLARAKAVSAERLAARDQDIAELLAKVAGDGGTQQPGTDSSLTPVSTRSLALAALSILDGTQGDNEDRLQAVTGERISAQCLRMAKLNLFQCLSVAGPEYEDVYCLGQHAVLDTGQCVASAASPMSPLLEAALPPRQSRSVMIPAPSFHAEGVR